jgi:long-chain acyl-CoA synthetase
VPRAVPLPKHTLPHFLTETARRCPNRAAVRFFGRSLSYHELVDAANRFAQALVRLGLQPRDRAALLPNRPQFVIAHYGGLRAGAVMTPATPLCGSAQLRGQLAYEADVAAAGAAFSP